MVHTVPVQHPSRLPWGMGIKCFLVIKHLLGLTHLSSMGPSHWDSNRAFILITISIWCSRKQIHGHTHHLATLLVLEEARGTDRKMKKGKTMVLTKVWASLVAQLEKNLPVMQETWTQSLGWEDPLEKGNAAHSSVLAWRIPWTV